MPAGTFHDRAKFLEGVKVKLQNLMRGLPGRPAEQWEEKDGRTVVTLGYMGIVLQVSVGAAEWDYTLVVPPIFPISRQQIAQRVETELGSIEA